MGRISGPGFTPPSGPLSSSGANPSVMKWAENPGIKSVLSSLNIEPSKITSFNKQNGIQVAMADSLTQIQLVHLNKDQITTLQALGLGHIELAMIISANDQIGSLKKKLKKIQHSVLTELDQAAVLEALGFEVSEDHTVIADTSGGLVVLQKAFEDLEATLEE